MAPHKFSVPVIILATFLCVIGAFRVVPVQAVQVDGSRFGVVIGDSIAEGHPALHGVLHPGPATYDPNYPNQPGQLSYELADLSGIRWYNHGIGSQTTEHVRGRWLRDVLALEHDPGDGRGSRTLTSLPDMVVVSVGVNDVSLQIPALTTQTNITYMADTLSALGIPVVFFTLPPSDRFSPEQIQAVRDMNAWMSSNLPGPNVAVVDLYSWFEDPANPGKVNSQLAADYIHPSKEGYRQLAQMAWDALQSLGAK
ncbi:MAG TPA: capsular biosynthesis protein [Firmicutes bacterium]|nr:capsular biosynthesis protein [Bacillota bacterium]